MSWRNLFVMSAAFGWGALGCAEPPPPKAPEPPPAELAPEPPPAEPAEPADAPVQDCDQELATESPIVTGDLGEGPRLVRLFNNSEDDIQARLLDDSGKAAIPGTLIVKAGGRGEFHVHAGVFMIRYRFKRTCEVRRGAPLHLTGPRAGVEISIKPSKNKTSESKMETVAEPL